MNTKKKVCMEGTAFFVSKDCQYFMMRGECGHVWDLRDINTWCASSNPLIFYCLDFWIQQPFAGKTSQQSSAKGAAIKGIWSLGYSNVGLDRQYTTLSLDEHQTSIPFCIPQNGVHRGPRLPIAPWNIPWVTSRDLPPSLAVSDWAFGSQHSDHQGWAKFGKEGDGWASKFGSMNWWFEMIYPLKMVILP